MFTQKANGLPNFFVRFIRRLAAWIAKLRAAGLSAVRIFHSTSTLPSATSSGTFLQAGPFRLRATELREDLICMLLTWPFGCGQYCFGHRHSRSEEHTSELQSPMYL